MTKKQTTKEEPLREDSGCVVGGGADQSEYNPTSNIVKKASSSSSSSNRKTSNKKNKEQNEDYDETDEALTFFYKPHTLLVLGIAIIFVIYFAFTNEQSTRGSVKSGLLGVCATFLLFSMVQMRDGLFVRPHPAFWRVIMGMGVIYLCALVFLLFQSADDARLIMKHIDPKLGLPLPERSYADDCQLYTPEDPTSNFRNLMNTINDEFIWAHFFGWWGKTLLLRDSILCWVLSLTFEVLELSLAHLLPNFHECWWDHVILDILVCNALGILMGVLTIKYLKMKEYNWTGAEKKAEKRSIVFRALKQFTPIYYDEYQWDILSSWKRFLSVVVLVIMISVIELNAFFLKTLLWIPPPHPINIWRLFLWCFIGTPGIREYYQFAADRSVKKLGTMAWICVASLIAEVLLCIKYGGAEFWQIPTPPFVKYPWIIGTTLFTLSSFYYFAIHKRRQTTKSKTN
ncbi:phosphatidylserine synthase [Cavenderia fasciculata]|uniref:Phosphatidylserine synthase n=1 Tax=Cavenderia fasciculata TaxID=261658 RepID=F4PU36_CACFS|nr:phosphatidylserine synthase [Cavenderia fasciculata]EGG20962.1 phosphatidylserine synthase [Cavenderia fasciculata]|eukprot:XP_004358812.1 phosphatidylserine synthase [Cavenderia fasciculata]